MLRSIQLLFLAALMASCASRHSERYAMVQNPRVELQTSIRKSTKGKVFVQEYQGITSMLGMDRHGNLRRHVLVTAEGAQTSRRDGEMLLIPSGSVPVPDSLYHLSGLTAYPLIVPKITSLPAGATARTAASSAPSGDLVEVEWTCTLRAPKERHYVARYEVPAAELRYAKIRGRWTLESVEYSEREYVQRWNRVPRR